MMSLLVILGGCASSSGISASGWHQRKFNDCSFKIPEDWNLASGSTADVHVYASSDETKKMKVYSFDEYQVDARDLTMQEQKNWLIQVENLAFNSKDFIDSEMSTAGPDDSWLRLEASTMADEADDPDSYLHICVFMTDLGEYYFYFWDLDGDASSKQLFQSILDTFALST